MSHPQDGESQGGGCPMHQNPGSPGIHGHADLTYDEYLKIPEICSQQKPLSNPAHHDEMLFIIIHQTYELWFKLVINELEHSMGYMQKGEVLRAHHFMKRVVRIMTHLVSQIHILETMTPVEFLGFRDNIMPASGFQSVQFREIEFMAGLKEERYFSFFKNRPEITARLRKRFDGKDLRTAYYEMLAQLGFNLPKDAGRLEASGDASARKEILSGIKPIYQDPDRNLPVYLLSESLVDFDQALALWREHHVRVVERVIGFKQGTGGSSGVGYLQSTTGKKCFPLLWEVRTYLEKSK